MRVVIWWTDVTGYAVACWRALAARAGIDLLVVASEPYAESLQNIGEDFLAGMKYRLLKPAERESYDAIAGAVLPFKPDAVVWAGWWNKAVRRLAMRPEMTGVRQVTAMDNPWKGKLVQKLARLKIGRFIDRQDAMLVAGERAWQFARNLKVPERKIYRGTYGFDLPLVKDVYEARLAAGPWPKRFLYIGRYVDLKGFDVLLPAYRKYRAAVKDPWPFQFMGQGPFAGEINAEPGCEDLGYKMPSEQPQILAGAGVFVLSSWYEAWSVALAEAMASGLPAICTEEVGATIDLIRNCYTGLTVATRDAEMLTDALRWMHDHYDRLPAMGRVAREFASAHSAELWAERVHRMLSNISK